MRLRRPGWRETPDGARGRANGVHEERLGAVVGGVGGEDARRRAGAADGGRELVCQPRGGGVAHLAADVLHVVAAAGRQRRDVGALHGDGQPVALGEGAHELLVLLGVDAAQAVELNDGRGVLAIEFGERRARFARAEVEDVRRGAVSELEAGIGEAARAERALDVHRRLHEGALALALEEDSLLGETVERRSHGHATHPVRLGELVFGGDLVPRPVDACLDLVEQAGSYFFLQGQGARVFGSHGLLLSCPAPRCGTRGARSYNRPFYPVCMSPRRSLPALRPAHRRSRDITVRSREHAVPKLY